ncbi:MAG: PQQ-like beta-propeller repeat protein [Pirellulales bacterium]|nr:PQQ-like beta-propeller repeat protein [Pirellulales bacterium]
MLVTRILMSVVLALAFVPAAMAENWPQFRGPGVNGLPTESRLPTEWGPEKNIAWQVDLPGKAWSQPVVWGDRVFLTTAIPQAPTTTPAAAPATEPPAAAGNGEGGGDDAPAPATKATGPAVEPAAAPTAGETATQDPPAEGDYPRRGRRGRGGFGFGGETPDQVYRWELLCLDRATGKVLWQQLAHEGKPTLPIHRTNTYASETPVTDGQRIYVYFGMTGLFCYDLAGQLLWKKDLGSYPMMLGWGTGSSPVLAGDRLFIQCDNEKESFLVALDKRTGDELWRVARDEKSTWSTPYLWHNKLRTELVAAGARKMRAYDPATGELLWESGNAKGRCSATPVGTDELLYVGVGGGPGGLGPLVAFRAGAKGDITLPKDQKSSDAVAWLVERSGPSMASPLVYQGCLYVFDQGGGIVGCYDAATGKQHYRKRIEGASGFTSSPWAYDGRIFCLDENGQTFVLAPGPELKVLATNKLDDRFWSSVAVAGDHLLLRGVSRLYCIAP